MRKQRGKETQREQEKKVTETEIKLKPKVN